MIRDLTEALGKMLSDKPALAPFPKLKEATVIYDRPGPADKFNPDKATIDLFLFDIRENMELRSSEPLYTRANGAVTITPPSRRLACTYLLTAWPGGPTDTTLVEHELLSEAFEVLSMYPTIPEVYLKGSALDGQSPPLPLVAARTDGLKDPAEFWLSIGNQLRPSIIVTATVGVPVAKASGPFPQITSAEMRFGQRQSPDAPGLAPSAGPPRFTIGGHVTTSAGRPAAGAIVTLVERGLVSAADADGGYRLGSIEAGTYTVRAQLNALAKSITVNVQDKQHASCDIVLPPSTQ